MALSPSAQAALDQAGKEQDAANKAWTDAIEAKNADPTNPVLIQQVKDTRAAYNATSDKINAIIDADSAQPSTKQDAVQKEPTYVPPQAASGETTADENTDPNFKSNLTTSKKASSAPTDQIAGLQQTKTNATPDTSSPTYDDNSVATLQNTTVDANTPHYTHSMNNGSGVAIPGHDIEPVVINPPIGNPTATDDKPKPNVSANILHNYASFTYSLSLHVLTDTDYDEMMTTPGGYKPTNVLIASAGRRGENANMQRNAIFDEDFFFDKLEMETVIGLNAQAKNSNAIHLSFTIIEPYGMTLLNRLLALGELPEFDVEGNYVALPYLLVIDFFGYGDDGMQHKIDNITKYIPIRILTLGMKVSSKGAEYAITAVPFNHQAFSETVATVPFKLEVAAGNISDFFLATVKGQPRREASAKDSSGLIEAKKISDDRAALKQQYTNIIRENEKKLAGPTDNTSGARKEKENLTAENTGYKEALARLTAESPTSASVQSFTGAFNAWHTQMKDDKVIEYADQIFFEIDPEIAEATFPSKDDISSQSSAMTKKGDTQKGIKTDAGVAGGNPLSLMTINQGTSILEVINLAIKNSLYIRKQILDPVKQSITEKQLKDWLTKQLDWFKVIPRIELGPYDTIRNEFSKITTYQIVKTTVINTKSEDAPRGGPKEYVKDYQYIFTGKNYDILNFDLKFDTLYWSAKTANPANKESTRGAAKETGPLAPSIDEGNRVLEAAEVKEIMDKAFKGDVALRSRTVMVGQINGQELGKGSTTESIKRLNNNILTNPSGDMISVDLKILGDPDFIKQDDFFYGPGDQLQGAPHKTPNHSIITDANEVFVNLAFNTPGDYNENGLAHPNSSGKYSVNSFSGLYRVLTVKSHFSNGKFEQNLTLIRHPNQDTAGSSATTTNAAVVDRPIDEFGANFEAEIARQAAMSTTLPNSSTSTQILSVPASTSADVQVASIDPTESAAYKAMKAGVGPEASNPSNTIGDMSGTNIVDVDASNGKLNVKEQNTRSEEDMSGINPYAGLVKEPAVPISGSSPDGTVAIPELPLLAPTKAATSMPSAEFLATQAQIISIDEQLAKLKPGSRQYAALELEQQILQNQLK